MDEAIRHCTDLLRTGDRDRYAAALMAREPARAHLMALYALDFELSGIRDRITEPLAGELRLQWWRDSIDALYHGAPADQPVLAALRPAIEAGRLPPDAFHPTIDARIFDQYDDPVPDLAYLEEHLGARFGVIFRLASLILAGGEDPGSGTAAGHAGMALGIATLLRDLPRDAARGKLYLPADLLARHGVDPVSITAGRMSDELGAALAEIRELARHHLDRARRELANLPRNVLPAFAPLGPVAPMLRASGRLDEPLRQRIRVAPLVRQWRMWRAARGRV